MSRTLGYDLWGNSTGGNEQDFDSNLHAAQDVSVDAVVTSLYYNTIVFIFLMASYEGLRRLLPTVYSSRKKLDHIRHATRIEDKLGSDELPQEEPSKPNLKSSYVSPRLPPRYPQENSSKVADQSSSSLGASSMATLPDDVPFDWVAPVFGVPWSKVRKQAGLDGYFFLRYIRMNIRITAVSSFWFFLILVPIYATGSGNERYPAQGWYHISASNLPNDSWRMWAPCLFAYLFSAFICFVIKQEYRHFLELRQDFLAKGTSHVNPQHHYSLMVEDIPYELRSDQALKEYFENLFPGKVHSACVVLNLPDLQEVSSRCMRVCRRLEKSVAYLHAYGDRPTHIVGRGRISLLGIDLQPLDCTQCSEVDKDVVVFDEDPTHRPSKGARVDSISYYTQDLAAQSRLLSQMQQHKRRVASSGNASIRADGWFDKVVLEISDVASQIMDDSVIDNDLISPGDSTEYLPGKNRNAESMTSQYGSITPITVSERLFRYNTTQNELNASASRLVTDDHHLGGENSADTFSAPFSREQYRSRMRRWAGRLGLDFVVALFRMLNRQLDAAFEGVLGATMSSTGFVTFMDLSSTTSAASVTLSAKASVLNVSIAPEPREIVWQNGHISRKTRSRREYIVDIVLALGVALWSFPVAAIQLFATAKNIAQIPGMEWILNYNEGFLNLVNGYLPVVALLTLVLILPVLFEYIATKVEHRKTFSDIQSSMLCRYFNYQLANIYITVTAGSLLKILAQILNHPQDVLPLLGESLPKMVGYFVALLVTKIMAGLPMIFLRFGALTRMLILKLLAHEAALTQRELDAVYRLENVQYGWEFPTQLLVVVIVFTYAIICPVILPVGLVYFLGALTVYKKQVLYVYSPVYESGGAMFPLAVQRTIFGLVCGQMTLLGYLFTRACYYQMVVLWPLPFGTLVLMRYFQQAYVEPSSRLSLERAREYDRLSKQRARDAESTAKGGEIRKCEKEFDEFAYRQPVLTELATEPLTYRRDIDDAETLDVRRRLRQLNRYEEQESETENTFPASPAAEESS